MTTADDALLVVYVGNFRPPHSTENHVAAALRNNGHRVVPLQEDDVMTWAELPNVEASFVLWTHTHSYKLDHQTQIGALAMLRRRGIPVVGYHLDRWWGLDRQREIQTEPFFRVDLLCTADGGHADQWARVGIEHEWFPPAVSLDEAMRVGVHRPEFEDDVVFVGSWERYHPEWPWRRELVQWLQRTYGDRCALQPPRGAHAIRGQALADLYTSAKVVVGDSCLVGGAGHYWSDRVPETLGRGGFLVHPHVEGMKTIRAGEHFVGFDIGDFDSLRAAIDIALDSPDNRAKVAAAGRDRVLELHTYEHRMNQLVALMGERSMIAPHVGGGPDLTTTRRLETGVFARFAPRPGTTDAAVIEEVWDLDTYAIDPRSLGSESVVVDLGANIGAFTLFAAAAGAHVIAYEPDSANVSRLIANVELNPELAPRILVQHYGVGGRDGVKAVVGRDANARLVPTQTVEGSTEPFELIDVHSIDDAITPLVGRVTLMKVDVEGDEFEILERLFDREDCPPVDRIVCEFHGPKIDDPTIEISGIDRARIQLRFGQIAAMMAAHGALQIVGRPVVGGLLWWSAYEQGGQ